MSEQAVVRFEDIIAWQKARKLAKGIYFATRAGSFARDEALKRQIQRAAVSVMSNVAEGFERGSAAEFSRFVSIVKASCAEVRSQLYLALDIGYLERTTFLWHKQKRFQECSAASRLHWRGENKLPMPDCLLIARYSLLIAYTSPEALP